MWPAPISATVNLTTDVPREYVWRAFESAPRWPEVLKDVEEAAIEPDGRLIAGAVMRSRAVPGTMAVDMAYHVLTAEPPEHLCTRSRAAGFTAEADYHFAEAANGGTELSLAARVIAEKFAMRVYIATQRGKHTTMIEASLRRRIEAMLTLGEKLWKETSGRT